MGNKVIVYGTYSNAGSSAGGDIDSGMHRVDFFQLTPNYSSVMDGAPVVNETFPLSGSGSANAEVTVVCNANESGYWRAEGQ